jgi:hypothetical protein
LAGSSSSFSGIGSSFVTSGVAVFRNFSTRPLLTFLSLTTKIVQMTTVTEMLVGAYKRHRRVHTSSNGTRGRRG